MRRPVAAGLGKERAPFARRPAWLGVVLGTALSSVTMLSACQSQQPPTVVVVPPTLAPTAPPAAIATSGSSTAGAGAAGAAAASPATAAQPAAPAASPGANPAVPAAAASPAAKPSAAASPQPGAAGQAAATEVRTVSQPGRVMYQQDAQHTGRSLQAGPRQVQRLRAFDATQYGTPDPGDPRPEIQSSATVGSDGTIYIGNFPGTLFALRDPGSGDKLDLVWRFHPAGASSFHTTPALGADGAVYVGFSTGGATPDAKGTFYALKAPASGIDPQVVWTVDLGPGRQTGSPTMGPDGTIYVVSGAGKLFALAPDGSTRWTATTGPNLKAAPALGGDGTVYVASLNGKLYAVAPPSGTAAKEGTVRWTFDFGEHPGSGPAVVAKAPPPGAEGVGSGASPTIGPDGTIYLGANNSNFYAVTPAGAMKWMFEAEREIAGIWSTAALSSDGATLYFGANKGGIYAVNTRDGSARWRFPIYGSVFNSPTLDSQGTLYTGSSLGHVFAIDSSTGRQVFDFDAGAPVWTAPAILPNGALVVGDLQGQVSLLGAR